ncbi:hypothetical protein DY590_09510, partial [Salmonella enterica]|nr:hypothetical protein [Salmonella enterica]ECJ9211603.1 hypothetical protein [Salmonella enterica]
KEVWVYDTDLKSFTTREVDLLDYDLPSAIATLLGKVEGAIYAQRSTNCRKVTQTIISALLISTAACPVVSR